MESNLYSNDTREELEERIVRFSKLMAEADTENIALKDKIKKMEDWCPICKRPRP